MITVTEKAVEKLKEVLTKDEPYLRVFVQGGGCSGFQYGLMIDEDGQGVGDKVFESNGIKIFIDPVSINYINGAEVDFTEDGGGFAIKNPNAKSTCGCGQSFSTDENN